MPYALRGNKVVKSDTGEVVKDHGDDHAKAVRHLRALKANVEESGPGVVTALLDGGSLLEGFAEGEHPRGYHGRWITAGKVLDVFHGNDRVGSIAKTKEPPFPEFTPAMPGGRTLRTRADMTYGVASLIAAHGGDRAGFPYAHHVEAAKRVIKQAKPPSGRHPEPTQGLPPDAQRLMATRQRANRSARKMRESAPEVLGALLEGA